MKTKPLFKNKKIQKLMTEIGGGWYKEKRTKGLPPHKIPKLNKKSIEGG